jgi:hypothetical protein
MAGIGAEVWTGAVENMPADTIDFLHRDMGGWVLWMVVPLMALAGLKAAELIRAGWRTAVPAIAKRLLIGLLVAIPINGFLMLWQRRPPQDFIKLQLESDRVVLGFRWPKPELAIPFGEIKNVQVAKSGTRRHPCSRVQIRTADLTYQSWGFGKFNEEEMAIMDKLRAKVTTASVPKPEDAAGASTGP